MLKKLLVFSLLCLKLEAAETTIGIADVTKKISQSNFLVLEQAERAYQAGEAVGVARGNLLPHLNLWDWIGFQFTPTDILGKITDIAPFLVPGNWFRVAEQKILVEAEKKSYHALWANQILTGKLLYFRILNDEALVGEMNKTREVLEKTLDIVRMREILGGLPPGTSKALESRVLAMQEDRRAVDVLLREEKGRLGYMMAVPATNDIKLQNLAVPDIGSQPLLKYSDWEKRALDSSPEIQQFSYLLRAVPYIKKEIRWSFLGTSSLSRGAAGGIFDDIPMQRGLGFGRGATMAILRSKESQIKLQRQGVAETIKQQLKLLVESYNLDLENYKTISKRKRLADEMFKELNERMILGDNVPIQEIIEVSKNLIGAEASMSGLAHRYFAHVDRLHRIIFYGDYAQKPPLDRLFPNQDDDKNKSNRFEREDYVRLYY